MTMRRDRLAPSNAEIIIFFKFFFKKKNNKLIYHW